MNPLKAYLSKQEKIQLVQYQNSVKDWSDGKTQDYMQLCFYLNFHNWDDYENFPDWRKEEAREILKENIRDNDSFVHPMEYIFLRALVKKPSLF